MKRRPAHKLLMLLTTFLILYMSAGNIQAQSKAQWTQLGPLPANTSAIAVDAAAPPNIYALSPGGLSRSADMGKTWQVCHSQARAFSLAVSSTLQVATWQGPKTSTNGCATWQDLPTSGILPHAANIRLIQAHPANQHTLFAGMDGLGGLYRSTNGGTDWQPASKGLPPGAWVTTLTTHPQQPDRIFIGLRYASRQHPPAYVFESTDNGLTWRSASRGLLVLPNPDAAITGLAWSGNTLFAASAFDGLYRFSEESKSWNRVSQVPSIGTHPITPNPHITSLTSNQQGALVVATSHGAFRLSDNGASWEKYGPKDATNTTLLAIDPNVGRSLIASGNQLWAYNLSGTAPAQASGNPTTVAQSNTTPAAPPQPNAGEPTPPPTPIISTSTPLPIPAIATAVPPTRTPLPPTRTAAYLPSDSAQPLDPAFSSFVKETSHNIQRGFRDYWLNNNGVQLLGYPLTEEFAENGTTVQYFERGRLEYRNGELGWGRLGAEMTEGQFFQTVRFFVSTDDNVYFGPTQHSASGPFLRFWRQQGGLATLGYPISESVKQSDGYEYQWFERGRLEWHRDLPEDKRIVLGLIGKESLQKRGWIK